VSVRPRTFFQVGVLVDDLDRAADELGRAVGLTFEAPRERRLGAWMIRTAFSLHGPPYVELIEGPPGSPWDHAGHPGLDHLGFWSPDLEADRERLAREGLPVAVDGTELGGPWLYHRADAAGMRLEHIDVSAQPGFYGRRGAPGGGRSLPATLDAYFAGINDERYDDVGALFAPDGVLIAAGTPPRRGAEIPAYFAAALRPYPQHRDDATRTILSGSTATVEIHFTGRHANGGTMEFDAVDVFDVDERGDIVRLTSWYDSHAVRRRLREIIAGAAD
jgi:ketosteroid isomerase-like protein